VLNSKYLVIEWEWLEDALQDNELEILYGFLERASFYKEEEKYYIVNTKEPFANEVLEILRRKGYKEPEPSVKITKENLLKTLEELSHLEDRECAYEEAVEALLNYIDDNEITEAFLKVSSWCN